MKTIPRRLFGEANSSLGRIDLKSDSEALRALVEEADHLGFDPDGACWLLIRTTEELVDYLAHLDGEHEDWEDELDGEREDDEENGDREDDQETDQPVFKTPFYPSAKDERELKRAQKWIDRASKRRRKEVR